MAAAVVYQMAGYEDEQNLIAHADTFGGSVANLTTPWVQVTGVALQRNGSGLAAPSGVGASASVVACGSVDHTARVKFDSYGAVATSQMWLIVKYIDATNYVAIGIGDETTGKLEVKAVIAGVSTAFDEKFLIAPSLGTGQIVRAYADGLKLHVFVDGVKALEANIPAALATGAGAGLLTIGSTGNKFDDFIAGRL